MGAKINFFPDFRRPRPEISLIYCVQSKGMQLPPGSPRCGIGALWQKSLVGIAAVKDGKQIGRIWLVRVPDAFVESLK